MASRRTRRCSTAWSTIGLKGDLEHNGKKIGLVLDVGGYYKNVITLAPSLEITHEEIDLALALLDQLLTKAKKG